MQLKIHFDYHILYILIKLTEEKAKNRRTKLTLCKLVK